MTQFVHEYIIDEDNPLGLREDLFEWFGRFSNSMLTMFEITLAPGAWSKIGRRLIYEVNPLYALFFIPYGWVVSFALVRVISAIFLKQTLAVASSDPETALHERQKKRAKEVIQLQKIFACADRDRGGTVTAEELLSIMEDRRIASMLAHLELDVHEVKHLFELLDDGDGSVSSEEFISGVLRMRGVAK